MHYYRHHIGDFIKDTANLDDHQLATYLRMLWSYYTEEKPITGDAEDVAFAMRSNEKTVRLLLRHFFVESSDGWRHNRCDREIESFQSKSGKASKSAKTRWSNSKDGQQQCEGNANACESNASIDKSDANQEPITNNQVIPKRDAPKRSRPPSVEKPDDVSTQTWEDWNHLRKAKKAPVTGTVVDGARREAGKAGVMLETFLQIWCTRGSQGLQADWLKPEEKARGKKSTHGFAGVNYHEGVNEDGSFD